MTGADTRFLAHFPMLRLAGETAFLEGVFRDLPFDEFPLLDEEWADRSLYQRHPRIFWCCRIPDPFVMSDSFELFTNRARLVHYALLASGVYTPSPELSVSYQQSARSTSVVLGRAAHAWILGGGDSADTHPADLERAARINRRWDTLGITADHPTLGPLRAVSSVASAQLSVPVAILVLVIALEGALLPNEDSGTIVGRLVTAAHDALGPEAPEETTELIQRLYAVRSDYIHGRPLAEIEPGDLTALVRLLALVTVARTDGVWA